MLEKLFKLTENGTTIKTEVLAGITTFMTMAYILAVNPYILSASGMDSQAVLIATALAAFVGTMCMSLVANYPFALAPGLGVNAYFAYTICVQMGYSWQFALLAVFVEGTIFIILTLTNIREAIVNAIPQQLQKSIAVGIGLFITFIGMQSAHLVVDSQSTLVSMVHFVENFHTQGISALLACVGLIIIIILHIKNVRGALLTGVIATWLMGVACQLTGLYNVDAAHGYYSLLPDWTSFDLRALSKSLGQCFNFEAMKLGNPFNLVVILFALLMMDMFDTIGTLVGVATKANMLDAEGKLPRVKQALLADAIATTAGAMLGTSTTTTFVESSAGVSEGGRTGLTAMVTALLFLLSIFLAPIFTAIPGFATGPALIYVGFCMVSAIVGIDFNNLTEAIPAFLCMVCMPFMYSISDGIGAGLIAYTIINVACGKSSKVTPLLYALTIIFILKYILL